MIIKNVTKWLASAPPKKEIVEFVGEGRVIKVIPHQIIKKLLNDLTASNWSTSKFHSTRYMDDKGVEWIDASIELTVNYRVLVVGPLNMDKSVMVEKEICRTLVGAATFRVDYYGQPHVNNTAKSLCINNAAMDLGPRFGKDLNDDVAPFVNGAPPSTDIGKIHQTMTKIGLKL